jgi:hypothetical protein
MSPQRPASPVLCDLKRTIPNSLEREVGFLQNNAVRIQTPDKDHHSHLLQIDLDQFPF